MSQILDRTLELYRSFFDAASDAIVVTDEGGCIVAANAACATLLGYEPATLLGRSVESLVPDRFRGHARQRKSYTADPKPRAMGRWLELAARHADGYEVPVDIALTPLIAGGMRLIAASMRDLRGRAVTGETLRVQATALRSAANGVVITDRNGTITWVNPAACAITGYHADELVGQHTRLLKSGEHDPGFYAGLWATVTRGETWSGTIVNRRKDGTLYHEEQTIAPVVDEAGIVTHFIAIKQDVTERRVAEIALSRAHAELEARLREIEELNRQLHDLAIRDPLTGLYNRRYLEETLARDAAMSARSGLPLAFASLDVDHFKQVNDTWGHAIGDQVLQQLAAVLRMSVRASDILCRVGGEEFVVVMPGASLEIAALRADEWRRAFAAQPLTDADGVPIPCTVSIGVAVRGAAEAAESAIRRADTALYAAKRKGRNLVSMAGEPVLRD